MPVQRESLLTRASPVEKKEKLEGIIGFIAGVTPAGTRYQKGRITEMTTAAFDVDGTLISMEDDTPRYEVIQLYKLLEKFGCEMFIWSGGGVDYAAMHARKLGLKGTVVAKGSFQPDIAIDDMDL